MNHPNKLAKNGTAHAVVQDDGNEPGYESVTSLGLEKDGMPTREELLERYNHLNVSLGLLKKEIMASTS